MLIKDNNLFEIDVRILKILKDLLGSLFMCTNEYKTQDNWLVQLTYDLAYTAMRREIPSQISDIAKLFSNLSVWMVYIMIAFI